MLRPLRVVAACIMLATGAAWFLETNTQLSPWSWIKSRLSPRDPNLVARVLGTPITQSQLDRHVVETLWLSAINLADLNPQERAAVYHTALDELIDHELLRGKLRAAPLPPFVLQSEVDQRIQRLLGRFETKGALQSAMKAQGILDETQLKQRIAARVQQEQWLESQISEEITPTQQDIEAWYTKNKELLRNPERIKARHVFLATLDRPSAEAKRQLDQALAALLSGQKDFPSLARELSDDLANKHNGGDLGWMTSLRLPSDLAASLFSLGLNQPTIIRSRLGWHLAEVTARKAPETPTLAEVETEIRAALSATMREHALAKLRKSLRSQASGSIEIFSETQP